MIEEDMHNLNNDSGDSEIDDNKDYQTKDSKTLTAKSINPKITEE